MFERFTDKARTAVIAARAEAAERGDQIRPVYMLHALAAGDGDPQGTGPRSRPGPAASARRTAARLDLTRPVVWITAWTPDALDPGFHCVRAHWIRGFMPFQLGRPTRTLPCRYVDLTIKTAHTVLTKSIYVNTESHNLS
jgi:hypothetical protein